MLGIELRDCARDEALLQTLVAHPNLRMTQEVGPARRDGVFLSFIGRQGNGVHGGGPAAHSLSPRSISERTTMYIGLGTILLIVVLFLVFRALSGRRV